MEKVSNDAVLNDLVCEIRSARQKFPEPEDRVAAMFEEAGELQKALLEQKEGRPVTQEQIYREAIQAAAMAIRVATEGDANYPLYDPESGYRGPNWAGYKSTLDKIQATISAGLSKEIFVERTTAIAEKLLAIDMSDWELDEIQSARSMLRHITTYLNEDKGAEDGH